MSDKPESEQNKAKENEEEDKKPEDEKENKIETCAGGLTEEQLKTLQEDLDRAKEDSNNSFSSSSRCVIV